MKDKKEEERVEEDRTMEPDAGDGNGCGCLQGRREKK